MMRSLVNSWRKSLYRLLCLAFVLGFQLHLFGDQPFSVQLVDASGKPVEGADLGLLASAGDHIREYAAKEKTEWLYSTHVRSDAKGIAHFSDGGGDLDRLCLIARHESRKIAAVASVDPNDLDEDEPIRLTLMPETQIVGRAACKQLADLKRELGMINVYVRSGGKIMLECSFNEPSYRLALPPGAYEIEVYGLDADSARKVIAVKAQSAVQQIDPIDLPATKLALLEGHKAPEIAGIVAWKNSGPVALEDLRGKCVLLDFWGYWCNPCVQQMPELFKLHDKYSDQGLVIIGIHLDFATDAGDRVDTVPKLDDRLLTIRKDVWAGRDVPFPVALVTSEEKTNSDGASRHTANVTVASYGIHAFPTQVLIDRKGNVVKKFYPNDEGMALLEKVLQEK